MRLKPVSRRRFSGFMIEGLEDRRLFAFGVTSTGGGAASYVVDNGSGLTFTVLRNGATTSNTVHLGDITSVKYQGNELLAGGTYSHYEVGLTAAATISYTVNQTDGWILVTGDASADSNGGAVIQYYAVRRNDNNIYMASYVLDSGLGEGRFIAYLDKTIFTNRETASDNNGQTGAIEGGDVYGHPDGTTTSKFYNNGRRMIENIYHGVSGTAGTTPVGAWMFMGNREHGSGGPFFKDIDFQTGSSIEMYNYLYSGHAQTEAFRLPSLMGPYAIQINDGSPPVTPDYSWMGALDLQGWIPATQRGTLAGKASGVANGHEVTVGLSNSAAQYWATPDAGGNYVINAIQPGTYTETLYDGELEVGRKTVTVTAGAATVADIASTYYLPSNPVFRIGAWDGTPGGFLNADKIEIMHPSDVRMSSWALTPNFVVDTNTDGQWPMAQFKNVNNSQRITFNLTSAQVQNLTLRIGITIGYEGGRNQITVNTGKTYAWQSVVPTASSDLSSRGITRGTWRGRNQLYTYNIPSSAFRAGVNTIDLPLVSGGGTTGFLSANVAYDAIDLVPTTIANSAAIASVTISPANVTVTPNATRKYTAVAKDAAGNVIPANFDWSATNGTIDANGTYVAPASEGTGTISVVATRTGTAGYVSSSASTQTVTRTVSGSGSTGVSVVAAAPTVSSFVIDDGATQRSLVRSLTVNFSEPVTLAAGALTLSRRSPGGVTDVPFAITPVAGSGNSGYRLTFTGSDVVGDSLSDGSYDLALSSTAVTNAFGKKLASGATFSFHRLFGDADGDRGVSINDFNALASAFATSRGQIGYNDAFDFDGDGGISINDFNAFAARFGVIV